MNELSAGTPRNQMYQILTRLQTRICHCRGLCPSSSVPYRASLNTVTLRPEKEVIYGLVKSDL